ncbi:hypothetical protein B0H19DRAFT_1089166 [Mycena capillaripes]|nr:hypothetical protein B0H19DRAFT_1089166 [Mycena capillaripes]
MIRHVSLTHATSRSLVSRPLKRGKACMNCRFLKIVPSHVLCYSAVVLLTSS